MTVITCILVVFQNAQNDGNRAQLLQTLLLDPSCHSCGSKIVFKLI